MAEISKKTDLISLAEAGKISGYHQDYLGALCRSGKLVGQKIGRNWVISRPVLEAFLAKDESPSEGSHSLEHVRAAEELHAASVHEINARMEGLKHKISTLKIQRRLDQLEEELVVDAPLPVAIRNASSGAIVPAFENKKALEPAHVIDLKNKFQSAFDFGQSKQSLEDYGSLATVRKAPMTTPLKKSTLPATVLAGVSIIIGALITAAGVVMSIPTASSPHGVFTTREEDAGVVTPSLLTPTAAMSGNIPLYSFASATTSDMEGRVLGVSSNVSSVPISAFDIQGLDQAILQNIEDVIAAGWWPASNGNTGNVSVGGSGATIMYPSVTYIQPSSSTSSGVSLFSASDLSSSRFITDTATVTGALNALGTLSVGGTGLDSSALLQVNSTSKGFLAPRMTTAERDVIASPASGLLIYNLSTDQFNVYSGGVWTTVGGGGASGAWSGLGSPGSNLTLSMGVYTSNLNWATGTGANNLFNLTTANSSNGTGYLLNVATGTSSTVRPLKVTAGSVDALTIDASGRSTFGARTTFAPSTTSGSSIVLPSGVAPTSPSNGDLWNQSGSLRFYDGSTTQALAYSGDLANTTDPAKGSSLIGFKQTAVGGVARTVNDKLQEIVSITDFGAVGDGTTNNTAAIQAAIDNGGQVLIPEGTFNFGSTITLKKDTTIIGKGKTSILRFTGSGVALQEPIGSYTGGYDNLKLKDFTLTTTSATSTAGIELTDNYQVTLDGLYIDGNNQLGFTTAGIHIRSSSFAQNSAVIRITNGEVWLVAGDAIRTSGDGGVAAVWIEHMHLTGSGGWGVNEFIPAPPYPQSNIQIVNNVIEGNVGGAVNIDNAQATTITGNYFENITGSTATLVRISAKGAPRGVEINRNVFGGKSADYLITLLSPSGFTGEISNNTFSSANIAAINATDTRGISIFNNFNDGSIPSLVAIGSVAQSLFIQDGSGVQLTAGSLAAQPTFTVSGSVVSPIFSNSDTLTVSTTANNANILLDPHGTGAVRVVSGVTTGSLNTAGFSVLANSLTSGHGMSVFSSSLTSGSLVDITVSSTAASGSTQTGLNVFTTGVNGTSTQNTYGAQISNTHTGTNAVNIGLFLNASGGTSNYGLYATASGGTNNFAAVFEQGNVGINTVAPTLGKLQINQDSLYSSENAGAIYIRGDSADSSMVLGSDAANNISYIQSMQNGTSFTTRPLALQPNGGSVVIGATNASVCCSVDAAFKLNAGGNAPLYIYNGGTDFLYINPAGNMGVGSITASSKLSVYGNAAIGTGYVSTAAPVNGLLVEGNVGIGDTSPAAQLTVGSGDKFQVAATGSVTFNAVTVDIATGTDEALFIAPGGTGSVLIGSGVTSGSGSAAGLSAIGNSLTSGTLVNLSSNSTGAASNTQHVLQVLGTGVNANSNQLTYGASIYNTHSGTGSVNIALDLNASGGATNYALYAGAGNGYFADNVGIGTATPGGKLEVSGGNIVLESGNVNREIIFAGGRGRVCMGCDANSSDFSLLAGGGRGIHFFTDAPLSGDASGFERMVLSSSGKLGIGVLDPVSILHVEQATDSAITTDAVGMSVGSGAGALTAASGAQTFASITPDINQSGTAGYTALRVNAAETTTGSGGHFLLSLQTDGADKFNVQSDGTVVTASTIFGGNDVYATDSGYIGIQNRSKLGAPAAGRLVLLNDSGTDFSQLQFGGETALFPSLKRSGAMLQARLADDTADAAFSAAATTLSGSLTFNGPVTDITTGTNESLLIAPNGTGSVLISSSVTSGSGSGSGLFATSSTLTSGSLVTFSTTSTAAAGNTQQVLSVTASGANVTGGQLTYGASISNAHTGGGINIALNLEATGGAANYALYSGTGTNYFGGNVGMGTTGPDANGRLTVVNPAFPTVPTTAPTVIVVGSSDGTTGGSSIRALGTITGGLSDVGEYAKVEGTTALYEQGDLLSISSANAETFTKSDGAYDARLATVVTTTAGILAGGGDDAIVYDERGKPLNRVMIALAGRVPVKISLENGSIRKGDFLTSSATKPGYAMRATMPGQVIGQALEDFMSATSFKDKVLVFMAPQYFVPTLASVMQDGAVAPISIQDASAWSLSDASVFGSLVVRSSMYIQKDLVVKGLIVATEIQTQRISAKQLCLDDLCITKDELKLLLNSLSEQTPPPVSTANPSEEGEVAGDSDEVETSDEQASDQVPIDLDNAASE